MGLRILKRYDTCLGEFSMLIEACGEVCSSLENIQNERNIKLDNSKDQSLAPVTGLKMKMADGVAASGVIRFSTWAEIHVGLVGLVVFR